jgi:hypothetical protein
MFSDVLRALSLSELTDEEKAGLRKAFETRRKELKRALAAVEEGLRDLSAPKRPAKKR